MYNYLYRKVDVVEEAKNVLNLGDNVENDCISLYDISLFYKNMYSKFENFRSNSYCKLVSVYNSRCGSPFNIEFLFFDYIKRELVIDVSLFGEMIVGKINNDICVVKPFENYIMSNEFFSNLFDVLTELYNDFMKYEEFINQKSFDIRTEDSNFLASISNWSLSIYTLINFCLFSCDFELSSLNSSSEYLCDCNSNDILNFIRGNEEELFKHLYIKINKCPEWCQEVLVKIRENQLNIIKKKQRRKEIIRKIIPFYKR